MSSPRPFLRIPAGEGDWVKKALSAASLLDKAFRIESRDGMLFFPLRHEVEHEIIREILGAVTYETGLKRFDPLSKPPRTLRDALTSKMSAEQMELLPRAYDLVGDIAVLELPDEIASYGRQIGAAFLAVHSSFTTVLAKRGAVSGISRTRQYELLAGQDKTKTVHTEYGCRIAVDLAKAYFSPRLLEEHSRVARQVRDGELIIDMFTGVGCFALQITRSHNSRVVAIDINPDAIRLLRESMGLNRLRGEITPVVADSRNYVRANFSGNADRIIMNHPSGALDFVSEACNAIKGNGTIHYYAFAGANNPDEEIIEKATQLIRESGRDLVEVRELKRVRESAPHEYQMVADLIIR